MPSEIYFSILKKLFGDGKKMIERVFQFIILLCFIGVFAEAQDLRVINSSYLKTNDSLFIYKPLSYSNANSYPLLYLLHGHSANYKSWSKLADLQALSDQYGMIIICPDGLKKSWYINSPQRDSSQYESFFFKELVPFIHNSYKINLAEIFITGASMGGYGALWVVYES